MHVRKVSLHISLRSPHILIRDDTFHGNGIFRKFLAKIKLRQKELFVLSVVLPERLKVNVIKHRNQLKMSSPRRKPSGSGF